MMWLVWFWVLLTVLACGTAATTIARQVYREARGQRPRETGWTLLRRRR